MELSYLRAIFELIVLATRLRKRNPSTPKPKYTFEKRYYVFHLTTRFVCLCVCVCVCVCVCLSVCHHVCGEMAGLTNMMWSEVNAIYKNLKMQH